MLPVFNTENTVLRCGQSILGQSERRIEVIAVDDASTDGSRAVLENLAAQDDRFRVVGHAQNRGHGASRNTGIAEANGRYLFHCDPDDTLPADALATLLKLADAGDADLARGTFRVVNNGHSGEPRSALSDQVEHGLQYWTDRRIRRIPAGHWLSLYRRSVFRHVPYPEDVSFAVDMHFLVDAYRASQTITITPDVVYHYHPRPDSASTQPIGWAKVYGNLAWRVRALEVLRADGFPDDGLARLVNAGEYVIDNYWAPMVRELARSDVWEFFEHWRSEIRRLEVDPWNHRTSPEVRAVREALLADDFDAAYRLLGQWNAQPVAC